MVRGLETATTLRRKASVKALHFHITIFIIQDNLLHVRAGVGNHLLHPSNMLDFEGTETTGNRILNFLRRSSYDFFLIQAYTLKILCFKLYCKLTNKRNVRYTELHTNVTDRRLNSTEWCDAM